MGKAGMEPIVTVNYERASKNIFISCGKFLLGLKLSFMLLRHCPHIDSNTGNNNNNNNNNNTYTIYTL